MTSQSSLGEKSPSSKRTYGKASKRRTENLSIRINPQTKAKLRKRCSELEISVADWIELMLTEKPQH